MTKSTSAPTLPGYYSVVLDGETVARLLLVVDLDGELIACGTGDAAESGEIDAPVTSLPGTWTSPLRPLLGL